jgi:hypothetical protein
MAVAESETRYWPFGTAREDAVPVAGVTDYGSLRDVACGPRPGPGTGQRWDAGIGLYDGPGKAWPWQFAHGANCWATTTPPWGASSAPIRLCRSCLHPKAPAQPAAEDGEPAGAESVCVCVQQSAAVYGSDWTLYG